MTPEDRLFVFKYKYLADRIFDLLESGYVHENGRMEKYSDIEYEAGLTFALAMLYAGRWPDELPERLALHQQNLEAWVAELDSKRHRDDHLDISGLKL